MEPTDNDGQPVRLDVADLKAAAELHRDDPSCLWMELRRVLDDGNLLRLLARRSAFHPNGFVKIALHPDASPRVRLHVWPPFANELLVNPHGHRWAFASWIITGSLRETTYIEAPRGRAFDVWDYAGADGNERNQLRTGRLAPQNTAYHERGQVYTRDRHEVHDAHPVGDGIVASLVVQGPPADRTPVYQPPGSYDLDRNSPITAGELRALLVDVAKILQPVA